MLMQCQISDVTASFAAELQRHGEKGSDANADPCFHLCCPSAGGSIKCPLPVPPPLFKQLYSLRRRSAGRDPWPVRVRPLLANNLDMLCFFSNRCLLQAKNWLLGLKQRRDLQIYGVFLAFIVLFIRLWRGSDHGYL